MDINHDANHRVIAYAECSDCFLSIQQHGSYYSLWVVGTLPKDMSQETVNKFMLDQQDYGASVAGSWEQIMDELRLFLRDMNQKEINFNYVDGPQEPLSSKIEKAMSKENSMKTDLSVTSHER